MFAKWITGGLAVNFGAVIHHSLLIWSADAQRANSTAPIPPSQDPFYAAPPGFESVPPGDVLLKRPDPSNITAVVNCSAAYNILYRTTDTRYKPSWAVTTLLVPHSDLNPNGSSARLLSYQIPYNSPDVDASPSYLLSTLYATAADPAPADYVAQALARGWYVSVPDFEGPLGAFFAGPQEGHAVLDATRAVLSLRNITNWDHARYVMWGYSGGSLASFFAAELQASYASELSFAGMAVGGLPSNVTQLIYTINGTPAAGFIPSILLGITAQYLETRDYLVSNLKTEGPLNVTGFLACLHYDAIEFLTAYAEQDIFEYFVDGEGILTDPGLARVFGNNAFPTYHGIPQMPLFVYKAISDELTSIESTDLHIQRYCEAYADILYQRNTVGSHDAESINGAERAVEWLTRWLDDNTEQTITGCTVETVTVDVSQSG